MESIKNGNCEVYAVSTVEGERVSGPANKVGYMTRADYMVNPPTEVEPSRDFVKEKTSGYLYLLYRNDKGADKTLRELGLLGKVQNAVENNPKLTEEKKETVLTRFVSQLKNKINKVEREDDDFKFERSYNFISEKFAIGHATVMGRFDGIVFGNRDGTTHIEGVINYGFEDIFTDPYDLPNIIPGEWNPDGKPYKITDTWQRSINGDF